MIQKQCLACNKTFFTHPCRLNNGMGKFCSRNCSSKVNINNPIFRKGSKYVIPDEARKRAAQKLLGKFLEEKSSLWKGENITRRTLHKWIVKKKGKASTYKCAYCSKNGKDWSSKNHKYKRDINEFIPLCRSCHELYDFKMGFRIKHYG